MGKRRSRRSEGSVERITRPDGTRHPGWYIRYTDAWGKRHREKGGRTKTAALALRRSTAWWRARGSLRSIPTSTSPT